ncbi:MAG TPA: hypothetical protein VK200_01205 [Candidatus Limnocylindrales bacterium]|nr:hypothetical protein [Candidatus Limnocylindrales bacterium]
MSKASAAHRDTFVERPARAQAYGCRHALLFDGSVSGAGSRLPLMEENALQQV